MSRIKLWNRAARAMREDDDPRWHAVADVLQGEALVLDGLEHFAELLNAAYKQASGAESLIRFGRKPNGDLVLHADNSEAITRAALTYLGEPLPDHAKPEPEETSDE